MKEKISPAVGIVVLIVVGVLVVVFGWKKVSGGADADVTQETINRYQKMAQDNKTLPGAGQPTHGAPNAGAQGNASGAPQ